MSEKPSGIAHHAVIHHLACMFLSLSPSLSLTFSTVIDIIHDIIAITVPATTMFNKCHIYILVNKPTKVGTLW